MLQCYSHHDNDDEINPDPKKPFWVCKNCKKLPKKVEIKEDSDTEEPEPEEPQVNEVNERTLRVSETQYKNPVGNCDLENQLNILNTNLATTEDLLLKKGQPPLPAPSKAVKEVHSDEINTYYFLIFLGNSTSL